MESRNPRKVGFCGKTGFSGSEFPVSFVKSVGWGRLNSQEAGNLRFPSAPISLLTKQAFK